MKLNPKKIESDYESSMNWRSRLEVSVNRTSLGFGSSGSASAYAARRSSGVWVVGDGCPEKSSMIPAFYINLDHDVDRYVRAAARFDRMGLDAIRVSAVISGAKNVGVQTPWAASRHVSQGKSHWRVMQVLLDSGIERAMVLEDDAVFRDDWQEILDLALSQADKVAGPDWGILHLGCYVIQGELYTQNVGHLESGWYAHAYVVNRVKAVSECLESWLGFPDHPWYELRGITRLYCYPMIAMQLPDYSRVSGAWTDRLEMMLGNQLAEFKAHCKELP